MRQCEKIATQEKNLSNTTARICKRQMFLSATQEKLRIEQSASIHVLE